MNCFELVHALTTYTREVVTKPAPGNTYADLPVVLVDKNGVEHQIDQVLFREERIILEELEA